MRTRGQLMKIWRKHENNARRRMRIGNIPRLDHANKRQLDRWHNTCEEMKGSLGLHNTWNLLKYLIDPNSLRAVSDQNMNRNLPMYKGRQQDLFEEITSLYLKEGPGNRSPSLYRSTEHRVGRRYRNARTEGRT